MLRGRTSPRVPDVYRSSNARDAALAQSPRRFRPGNRHPKRPQLAISTADESGVMTKRVGWPSELQDVRWIIHGHLIEETACRTKTKPPDDSIAIGQYVSQNSFVIERIVQTAPSPDSPVRMRITFSRFETKIFPSPIFPVRAPATMASTAACT